MIQICSRWLAVFAVFGCLLPAAGAEQPASDAIVPTEYLVLPAVGRYGRLVLHRDAVEAELVAGTWTLPTAGDTVESVDGRQLSWQLLSIDDGALDTKRYRGGWAVATFDSPVERVMLLEAKGHAAVYVNGDPHAGDPYNVGWLRVPVRVRQGRNTLLFHLAADKLAARLTPPPADIFFNRDDRTLPTIVPGESEELWAAVPLVNATADWLEFVNIETQAGDEKTVVTPVTPIPPLSVRKVPFQVHPAKSDDDSVYYELRLMRGDADESNDGDQPIDVSDIMLDVVGPEDVQIRTFRSRIDGSVQPYAVRPAMGDTKSPDKRPGIILTLHDSGATCEEHVARYSPKSWSHIVAPQGRRPQGFDWEAWSRIDVLEALADVNTHYESDSRRICLTGNRMGGHGVWHMGVTYPDKFAALGASDGWISFWSYGGGMPSLEESVPIDAMMLRGYSPSDTVKLLPNLADTSVFILHDPAADKVPVEQARFLRQELASFHPHFVYHERGPEAGDAGPSAGHVSSPQMMDFFRDSQRPAPRSITAVDFTTADPAISSACEFIVIDAQLEQLVPSRVEMKYVDSEQACVGTTNNIARLGIRVTALTRPPVAVTLDNQLVAPLNPPSDGMLWFELDGGRWVAADPPAPQHKHARRNGTFTAAIDGNVLLVYGTKGNREENRWAEAKARYDAETFYYRAGGTLEMLPDTRFDPHSDVDRNVILYGNADTNAAWSALLPDCPVDVRRGEVRVGDRTETGDELAVLMVRPRNGSATALIGVIGGTGPVGMRLTNRLRWYVSGIIYPDLAIIGPEVLTGGDDVRAWGYFSRAWELDDAEIVWRDQAP